MATLSVSAIQSGNNYGFSMSFSGIFQQELVVQYAYQVGGTIVNSTSSSYNFYGLSCGTTYSCLGAYTKNGTTWFQVGTGTNYTTISCPPPPVYPSSPTITSTTSTPTTITTYVQFGANTHHVNVYIPQASVPTQTLYSNGSVTHTGLTANTLYTVYYQAWDSSETYGSGSQSFTKLTAGARPTNWSWSFSVSSGQPCSIPASEWILFQNKINAFRVYKGLSNYGFTTGTYVVSGQPFMAFLANQAVNAVDDMNPPTTQPSIVTTGQDFSASWLSQLTNSLNSIV